MEVDETLPAQAPATSGGSLTAGVQAGGRYKILRFVATGAMGEVYAAEDLIIGTTVALKVLRADLQGSATAIARLRREIALARQVTDVHVCRVHDLGEHEGRVFLTMELLEGKTLADHLAGGPLTIAEVERLARQLVDGLAALHRAGVVHRDFKCANTMLVGAGDQARVVITDFGLARSAVSRDSSDANLTAEAAVLGTPAYMAPEQAQGKPATAASDIYALGVVLFELLTGKRPFTGDSAMGIATARLTQDPPRPSTLRPEIPARWDAIVLRCLALDPAARFARAADVLPASAAPGRSKRLAIAGVLAAAAIGAGVVAVTRGSGEPVKPVDSVGMPPPGLSERRLTMFDGLEPVWNVTIDRAGERIAYVAGNTLWIRDLAQPEARRIELPADRTRNLRVFGWFPDGHRLFVRTGELDALSLDILDLRDASLRSWRTGIRYARLTAAGDRVAYLVNGSGVMVAPLAGTGDRLVAAIPDLEGYQLAWSQDGNWIAVIVRGGSAKPTRIDVIAADGSGTSTIPAGELDGTAGLVWAGSDRLIYTRRARVAEIPKHVPVPATEICSIGIVDGLWDRASPRCGPKRENVGLDWLAFAAGRLVFIENRAVFTVETVAVDGRGVPSGPSAPLRGQEGPTGTWGFTPDGQVLLVTAGHGKRSRIVAQQPGAASGRTLAGNDDDELATGVGDAILFTRQRGTTCELVREHNATQQTLLSEPRAPLTSCPYLRCALGAPRCVLVRVSSTSYIFRRFDLTTGREVGPARQRPSTGNVTVDLSNDGSTMVWAIEDPSSPAIALLEVDSGDYRELRPKGSLHPHDVSWLPKGEGWLVAGLDTDWTAAITRLRPDGTTERLVTNNRALGFHNAFRSLDGRTLVFQVQYQRTDIVGLEGFR